MNKNKLLFTFFASVLLSNLSILYSMMEMAIMMGSQQGASIANQAISKTFQDIGTSLQKDQSTLQDSLQLFSAEVSKAQSSQAKTLGKIFTSSVSHIATKEGGLSGYTQQMQNYIFKAISLHKAPFYYLISPLSVAITLDQAFTHATMYTPAGASWKNIFQYGDWEYDQTSDSFYQFKKISLFSTENDPATGNPEIDATTEKPKQSSSKAAFNSIFTEFFTYATSYEIQCEITLYQIEYPFFVGLQFNKTRWISGNADSLTKSRLFGIYGASATDIGTYYTEQRQTSSPKNSTDSSIEVLYPLDQIVQKSTKKQTTLSTNLFKSIPQNPITFTIRLITSPQKIEYKIWPKNSSEPKNFSTIKSSQKDLYLYHGIGFMSPGAIAQFKLLKPTRLLFSQGAQKDFAQEVKTLITQ